jgi:DNA polymerase III epsilon subunit-like protein
MTTFTLVFDTETTGLPPKRDHRLEAQPWILQLACILYRDSDRWPVAHLSTYLAPTHGDLAGAFPDSDFHRENKLTAEHVLASAMPLETGMKMFNQMLRRAHRLVAHNMAFDDPRMRDQYKRLDVTNELYNSLPKFCTMETLTDIMRLPGKIPGKFKWPNLAEAYCAFVDPAGFTDAHDAMNDVQACARVLHAIEDRGFPLYRCN